jgi:hypothetical protein
MPETSPTREDALLLIAEGATGPYNLDPIRLMKGAFLVSQIGPEDWRDLFAFGPYHYGPFDSSVYRARDALIESDLLRATPDGRYDKYEVTEAGKARIAELEASMGLPVPNWMRGVGQWVTGRSFSELLNQIYKRYPEFAKRSVVR